MFMSDGARAELARLSVAFFNMYSHLSKEALDRERRQWKMIPKFHLMQHLLEHRAWINARNTWAYADEDLQKLLKAVARRSHATNVPFTVLYKWTVHLHGGGVDDLDIWRRPFRAAVPPNKNPPQRPHKAPKKP
eukprot:5996397-Pyramimonas_sp.AAC.1